MSLLFAAGAAPAAREQESGMTVYLFFREDGFYPLELKDDTDAVANAQGNPGTLRVVNAATSDVVWSKEVQS